MPPTPHCSPPVFNLRVCSNPSTHLVRGDAGHERGVHLEPVAEHVQHDETQEGDVVVGVQHAQHGQQACRGNPAHNKLFMLTYKELAASD